MGGWGGPPHQPSCATLTTSDDEVMNFLTRIKLTNLPTVDLPKVPTPLHPAPLRIVYHWV